MGGCCFCESVIRLEWQGEHLMKVKSKSVPSMRIFLSHVSNEAPLAVVLKKWIEACFIGKFEIFVSSDIKVLPAGNQWLKSLEKAIDSAEALIVLCSPYSVTKPWVMFESGGAWVKKIPVIPICHSGQAKNTLPFPLAFFQALEVDSPLFVHDLILSISKQLDLSLPGNIDQVAMVKEIKAGIKKIRVPTTTSGPKTTLSKPRKQLLLAAKPARILMKISTSNYQSCTCKKLAKSLKIPANNLDVHLRHLMDGKLILKKVRKGSDCWYLTTAKGRRYLVRHKLI